MTDKSLFFPRRLLAEVRHSISAGGRRWIGDHGAALSGGNDALALLCNTLPTGAILTVLILTLGPLSGAHFNPAVSIAAALRRDMPWPDAAAYIVVQIAGGLDWSMDCAPDV